MNKKVVIMASILLFVLVSSVCFSVGYSLLNDDESTASRTTGCTYTEQEYVDAIAAFDTLEVDNPYAGVSKPAPLNEEALKELEGKCVIDALEEAKEIGITSVRDFTECWPDCMITLEYAYGRMNFVIENGTMTNITVG